MCGINYGTIGGHLQMSTAVKTPSIFSCPCLHINQLGVGLLEAALQRGVGVGESPRLCLHALQLRPQPLLPSPGLLLGLPQPVRRRLLLRVTAPCALTLHLRQPVPNGDAFIWEMSDVWTWKHGDAVVRVHNGILIGIIMAHRCCLITQRVEGRAIT